MLEESNHIDKLFADYLGDFEEKAPGYLWQNIQSDLYNQKRLKRNSRIRAIAASVALLITFGLGYISSDITQKNKELRYLDLSSLNYFKEQDNVDSNYKILDDNAKSINISPIIKKNSIVEQNIVSENHIVENKGFLYKIFDLSRKQFLPVSEKKAIKNQYAFVSKKSSEENSNQLLIDTLFLEEGSLPEGGFLLSKKKEKSSRWSFGTKFSPVYSMAENQVQMVTDNPVLKTAINNEKPNTQSVEKSLLSFSGGLNVNYRFAQRWSVESGLFYSQRRQMADNLVGSTSNGIENQMVVYTPEGIKQLQPDLSSPAITGSQVLGSTRDETFYSIDMNYISHYEYLELPIIVRYKIVDRKVGVDVLSGISTDFLIGNRSSIVHDDISLWNGQTKELSPLLYNATIGFGLNYNFYQNFSFNLEPTFKYSLINSESASIMKYPYSFAVFAGFSYRFK